jgi:hypothetical protein
MRRTNRDIAAKTPASGGCDCACFCLVSGHYMPLYFFHLRDGDDFVLDREGRELEDFEAVARIALREARGIIAEEARVGSIPFDNI